MIEFGFLFSMALSVGFFLGWVMAVIIGDKVFKLSWSVDWEKILMPALLLSLLCLATIMISSWRALKARPRELLSDS
jgi:predicted lysophospholipase L1 biosynthesis ABC-type transport system permease subunit